MMKKNIQRFLLTTIFALLLLSSINVVKAAKLTDGTWSQSGSPGTTTITFTSSTGISSGDQITLTFPSEATVDASGTDISITGSTSPSRSNNGTNNTITITADGAATDSITITMSDALSAYTASTYAQQSVAISHVDSGDTPVDFGVALISNDNTTDVRATVPLFVTMSVDTTEINLGVLNASTVSSETQTYTVTSNNSSGVTLQISGDAGLNVDASPTDDIDDVSDNTVTAGSEEYGIALSLSSLNAEGTFDTTNDHAVPTSATDIASSTGTVSGATLGITYKASVDGNSVAGDYHQVVTVTVATNS